MTTIWARAATFSICVTAVSMLCQTTQTQGEIGSALNGKTLLLRNFYSGTALEYDRNGALPSGGVPGPWTLANVKITHVATTAQGIEIVGDRMGAWFGNGKVGFVRIGKLRIHIARSSLGVESGTENDTVFSKVFIQPAEDLLPAVPEYWRYYLQGSDSKVRRAAWRESLEKKFPSPALNQSVDGVGGVVAPRLISSPEPKYSKAAQSQHLEGTSRLVLVVDTAGNADNIAILDPLGMGLDEQAVLAVEHWKFRPATKNGQPVRVEINIEVTFRCCP